VAGDPGWINLDALAAVLSRVSSDGRALATAAVCSQAFVGTSGRRLTLFFPKPFPFERRSDVWRIGATLLRKFLADPDLADWYFESVWVPSSAAKNWCVGKGFKFERAESPKNKLSTPKPLRGRVGRKAKYDWQKVKTEVFAQMDRRGDFKPPEWIRAMLIQRLRQLREQKKIDYVDRGLEERLNGWIEEWRILRAGQTLHLSSD
jgi:hypothetical protein